MRPYGILELSRTGRIAMVRSDSRASDQPIRMKPSVLSPYVDPNVR
jgi:hypothetical protein